MSDAALKIVVGADVQGAITGLNQVDSALDVTNLSLDESIKQLDKFYIAINRTTDATSIKGYEASITSLEDHIHSLEDEAEKAAESLKQIPAATDAASSSGEQFLGSISKQRVALVDFARVATGSGFSVRSLGSQLALFPLPVVAAVAAAALLTAKLFEYIISATDAEKATALLNNTIASGAASQAGEIDRIKDLVGYITDETNKRTDRARAFKDLQDQYPNALKNMDFESTSAEKLTAVTDRLTDALIRQAQIKGLESAISKVSGEIADMLTRTDEEAVKSVGTFGLLKAALSGVGASASIGEQIGDQFSVADTKLKKLEDSLKSFLALSYNNNDQDLLGSAPKADKVKDLHTDDETLRFLEETKKNLEEIEKFDPSPAFKKFRESAEGEFGQLNTQILEGKIGKAMEDGAKHGVSQANIGALVDSLKGLGNKQANPDLKIPLSFDVDTEKEDSALSQKIKTFIGKFDKQAYIHLTIAGFNQAELAEREAELKKIAKQFGDSFQNIMSSTLSNAAEAIGSALSGESPILKALTTVLSNALKAIGALYIKTGVEALLAKQAFEKFLISNPELSIAAGVALEVFAGSLKGKANSAHAFADGGIVTGPTLGLVGEAGPEVIFPLAKLNQFIKGTSGSGQNINVTGKLSGTDIYLQQQRTARHLGNV